MQACFQCSPPIIALCAILLATPTVRASDPVIVQYGSGSDITQHLRIDLDQKEMESYLSSGTPDWDKAKNVYMYGGSSGGYATIQLEDPLVGNHNKGVTVIQAGNPARTGTLKSNAVAGEATIKVSYTSTCMEGGYALNGNPVISGCFKVDGGAITVDTTNVGKPTGNIMNTYRTLQGFSTQAQTKMAMQETYQIYRAYYGAGDYANQYVLAALGGSGEFNGLGNDAREQGAKKGTAYMNVWMYVIHEIEDAIMDCQNSCTDPTTQTCNQDPVHAIDEAAAFYAGSLEGSTATGNADNGKLVFRLAQKRCGNFGTCLSSGQAKANQQIISQLSLAQTKLRQSSCVEVVEIKKRIVELMSIPLIQGSIRYAYKVGEDGEGLKAKAEGAVFSAAILPRVAACDAAKAQIISNNQKIDAGTFMTSGFKAVKEAFEATYECLGITCEDIGGLLVSAVEPGVYKDKAAPCVTPVMVPQNQVATSSCRAMRHLSLLVSWFFLCSGFFQF